MADKEFTQICKEILGVSKKLEKIEPEELRKIKTDIERISEAVAADKTIFDTNKKDFDGKYNKIAEIIKTFDTLKAQIEEVLKSGTINDSAEALISTFSSKKIMDLLNEAERVVDEKFSTIHKNGITPWNSTLEYPTGAISVLNGKLYQAKTQNTNKNPSENKEIWHVIANKEWCEQTFLNKNEKIDAYTKSESDNNFALKTELTDGLPIGAYLSYPSQKTIPAGFLIADGRSLKKSEYSELFNVLGYIYGGSGENFNLPNFSDGKFMRSIGGSAASLGVVQQDAIDVNGLQLRSIVPDNLGNRDVYGTNGNDYRAVQYTYSNTGTDIAYKSVAGKEDKPIFATSKPANETRPLNMSVVVLIKAKDVNTPIAGQIDKTILATETKAGIAKLKNSVTAKQEDAAVTEKAVSDLFSQIDFRCAARVIFNGQGSVSIIDSKNISSIVKNGVGDYTIKFLKPMEDTNYYIFTSLEPFNTAGPNHVAHPQYQGIKRESLRIITGYGPSAFADETRVQVLIFAAN
ncbi:tail fiber protein [Campylobacter concisus]|uniref:tail fiber protein n=1 Tax=Campylobacter concisus TaxID=199 RepID=UPI000D3435BA|nr:tail fiber protein [Campylobacter concisus]